MRKKRLGEILLERRLINVDQLNAGLSHQRQWGMRLGTALVAKAFISEGALVRVLSESLGIPMVDLSLINVDPAALALVPSRVCERYEVFPVSVKPQPRGGRRQLTLAMADPLNVTAIDEIAFTSECNVVPAIAQISSLDQAIRLHYHGHAVKISPIQLAAPTQQQYADHPAIGEGVGNEVTYSTNSARAPFVDAAASEDDAPVVMGVTVVDNQTLPPEDPYAGQPTGAFARATSGEGEPVEGEPLELGNLAANVDLAYVEAVERKVWAIMRVLTRRGLVTKDEFLAEIAQAEQEAASQS
jgi:type IV pilus assembly protein PilB